LDSNGFFEYYSGGNGMAVNISHIQTVMHGRYLVETPKGDGPSPLLVGFHGYGERAEDQMARMLGIPGSDRWVLCSIQGLHAFYNRYNEAGASWMTGLDRELRIKENITYIDSVIKELQHSLPVASTIVFTGFSQGTAMACRAALLGEYEPSGVMLSGGDIPPEFDSLNRCKKMLMGRGSKDRFYPYSRWRRDIERLKKSGLAHQTCEFDAGHIWHMEFAKAAGSFLSEIRP
jgi:predicted esterase